MGALLVAMLLSQVPVTLKAAVVDVSQPDAIYEDVSRVLAMQVVDALNRAGFVAVRVDENELPEEGCRTGPCLGEVARAQGAHVLVTVDAAEAEGGKSRVTVMALWGANGEPLAGARYGVKAEGKAPKELGKFAKEARERATARAAKGP